MSTRQLRSGAFVEDAGQGTSTVLCIHGLGGSSNTWTPVMPALTGMRVLRLDLPGSARSPLGTAALSTASFVETIVDALDELEVPAAHVLGHSYGTAISFHLAVRHPTRVLSLVMFGPLLAPPDQGRAGTRARATLAREKGVAGIQEIADAIVNAATSPETKAQRPVAVALVRESVMRQPPEGYAQSCEALASTEPAQVEAIKVPTLLVTGADDGVGTPAGAQAIAARIAGAKVVVLPGCGHWTTFEKPTECLTALHGHFPSRREHL